ncbi:hypothetical protein DCC39_07460 [Pueribacillus theae]|uniref:HTH cro/C1-type domain-containing protein n=1 Tax=Pueribacillus theae TaxID=2171751 RepID=A0A2U1K4K4_9BACI|nr:helix-turn-helix transcriptional regulator [Pueribacillus theae]PWA12079.1 hypothetical protein DCC39_07460 [Pueribacillus theae]
MIRNRLAVLLAERGLKITRVAKDTGISRNTITATAQNDSEMIRLETINTLCKYLSITPCEFFEYEPVDLNFSAYVNKVNLTGSVSNDEIRIEEINIDLFMDVKESRNTSSVDLHCSLEKVFEFDLIPFGDNIIPLKIEFDNDKEKENFIKEIFNHISPSFQKDIYNDITSALKGELVKKLKEEAKDSFVIESIMENSFGLNENIFENIQIELISDVFKQF